MPVISASAALILVISVYVPALHNGFVTWDDDIYIYSNPHIRSLTLGFIKWAFTGFYAGNWHPLTWLSHAADYALWGLHPLGHHLSSILLHGLNTFLVVVLVRRLLEAAGTVDKGVLSAGGALAAGTITGLLFGLHPLHVESVAWVSERKDVLYAFFYLLSLLTYIGYVTGRKGAQPWFRDKRYYSALLLFVLSLLSKPMAVSLPLVLVILDWYPLRRFRVEKGRSVIIEKIPYLALSAVSAALTMTAQVKAGAVTSVTTLPLHIRILVANGSLLSYIARMVRPARLLPLYPYPQDVSLASFGSLFPLALTAGITCICIALLKKRKAFLALWGYYVVTLLPVLGIIQAGEQAMADRYTYLASLGPFLFVGVCVIGSIEKAPVLYRRKTLLITASLPVGVLLFAVLSFTTIQQIHVWENGIVLWSYELASYPLMTKAYRNRGDAYADKGFFAEALEDYSRAVDLDPRFSEAYNQRGIIYTKLGFLDKALGDFSNAIMTSPRPDFSYYVNRGVVHAKRKGFAQAVKDYTTAVQLNPYSADAYRNRGIAYKKMGLIEEAGRDFKKAAGIQPGIFQ